MVAKQLNVALSDEKLREQWLKRVLPALLITVIYFVFISSTLSDKTDKAEQAYIALISKGISGDALPGIEQENNRLRDELLALKQKDQEIQANLTANAGFLAGQSDMNEAISRIAQLMQANHLQIVQENSLGEKNISELPQAFADLRQWLGETLKEGDTVYVHRIQFIGAYLDTYQAMKALAQGDIKALPLYLSMKSAPDSLDRSGNLKNWTLDLWL